MERVLELENIGKTFAGVTVLRNISLHLEKAKSMLFWEKTAPGSRR
jgi:ABC-type sugar transport system ATPase subunit